MNKKTENLKLNLILNIIYQVVVVLSPLIITPKISRVFGADYIGLREYTYSIVYYFAVFGTLGLDMYGMRQVARYRDDMTECSKQFFSIWLLKLFFGSVSVVIFLFSFVIFNQDGFSKSIYLLWLIYLVRECINPAWYLQGKEKYKFLSVSNAISQIAYVVVVFLFINEKSDLLLFILFYVAIPAAITLITIVFVLFDVKKFPKIKVADCIKHIKPTFIYFVPTIAAALYTMVDKTMLGIFDSSKVLTGYYGQAEKIVKVATALTSASFPIMRSRMSYCYENQDENSYKEYCEKFISLSMLLCVPITFGIIGVAKDFVPIFFGEGYDAVTPLLYAFSSIVPCLTISGVLQAIYIFPLGKQGKMNIYYVIVLVVNLVLNLCFIPLLGAVGAVIASIVSELLLAVILLVKSREKINIKLFLSKSVKYIISAVIMLGAVILISKYLTILPVVKLILEVVIGAVVYMVCCLLLRDAFIIEQAKTILSKLKTKGKNKA